MWNHDLRDMKLSLPLFRASEAPPSDQHIILRIYLPLEASTLLSTVLHLKQQFNNNNNWKHTSR